MATIEEKVADVSISLGYARLYCNETEPCLVKKGDAIRITTEQREIDEEMFCMFLNSLRESNAWEGREWKFTRLWREYKSMME